MPPVAGECPSQAREIAGWRLVPPLSVRVAAIHMDKQPPERADILVVVAHDVDERPGLAESQVVEKAPRDLPAGYVAMPPQPEQLRLHRCESGICHAVTKHASDERQQVQVAGVGRRVGARHPEPGDKERPVEAPPVVRDQPAAARDARRQLRQECGLVRVIRQEQLDLAEQAALPPAEPDEERERSGRGGEARRLGVQAEEGSVRRRLARQPRESLAIDR